MIGESHRSKPSAWLLMREFGIRFEEIRLRFDGFSPDSQFKKQMTEIRINLSQ